MLCRPFNGANGNFEGVATAAAAFAVGLLDCDSLMISRPLRRISVDSHRNFEKVVGRAFCYLLKIAAQKEEPQK
jgi:hypothetical protein